MSEYNALTHKFDNQDVSTKISDKQHFKTIGFSNRTLHLTFVINEIKPSNRYMIILQQINNLVRLKHKVTLITYTAKPEWFPLEQRINYIQVALDKDYTKFIVMCDLVIVTDLDDIVKCIGNSVAPVVYYVYTSWHNAYWQSLSSEKKAYVYQQYQLPSFILTFSEYNANQIEKYFDVKATAITSGINERIYYHQTNKKTINKEIIITVIASDQRHSKQISIIKAVLDLLTKDKITYQFNWITPSKPRLPLGYVYVNPKQSKIGEILRKTDIYIAVDLGTKYDMSILEAMACGCVVITCKSEIMSDHINSKNNCMLIDEFEAQPLYDQISLLVNDEIARRELQQNAINTVSALGWSKVIVKFIAYYQKVATYKVMQKNK
ncbi:MAG: glycosyltransferase [Erysipelotrichaceae bacterium]|nr:glycosyltransferase [Erysipelotrichaceae bacterium]